MTKRPNISSLAPLILGGVVSDVFSGQKPSFSSFGVAYVPEAIGTQVKLPEVSGNPIQQHLMDSVLQSMEYRLNQFDTAR